MLPTFNDTTPKPVFDTTATMPAHNQGVYVTQNFSEPMTAQHNFANQFDLNQPEAAMSSYQK